MRRTHAFVVLVARLRRHLQLKGTILIWLLVVLIVPFVITERWPVFPVTAYPATWLDRTVPFLPIAAWPYLSLWFYMAFAGLMLVKRDDVWRCFWIMAAMGAIADLVFLIHPTLIPIRPVLSVQPYAFIVAHDGRGNACPSLHVAYTLFAAVMMHDWLPRFRRPALLRTASWTWASVIVFSTLAIRQHVAMDVAGGAVLGVAGAVAWRQDLPGLVRAWLTERRASPRIEGGYDEERPYAGAHQHVKEGEVLASSEAQR